MSELTTIARPYAKAAFEFARDNKCIENWQKLLLLLDLVLKDQTLQNARSSLSKSKFLDLLLNICSKDTDSYFSNFIKILEENNRLNAITEILSLFNLYKDKFENRMQAEVFSFEKLSKVDLDKIKVFLEDKYKCSVDVVNLIDKSIISGVIIKTPNDIIDASLKNKINSLYSSLLS